MGSVDLTQLPESLEYLDVERNNLIGSLYLGQLPAAMRDLFLSCDSFTGSFSAANLPIELQRISAFENEFCAIAVVNSQTKAKINLEDSGVPAVFDEKGDAGVRGVRF